LMLGWLPREPGEPMRGGDVFKRPKSPGAYAWWRIPMGSGLYSYV
jgi:hypothetical protein